MSKRYKIEHRVNPHDEWKKHKQFSELEKAKQSFQMLNKHISNMFKGSSYDKYRLIDNESGEVIDDTSNDSHSFDVMGDKFKVIIAGGRDFDDFRFLCKTCMYMLQNKTNVEVVSGTARGADKLGEKFAKFMGYDIKLFPPHWDVHGKVVAHIRYKEMAKYANALIVFWDGESEGTKNMIDEANRLGLKVVVKKYFIVKDKEKQSEITTLMDKLKDKNVK